MVREGWETWVMGALILDDGIMDLKGTDALLFGLLLYSFRTKKVFIENNDYT
jgi:hypothetical protein